MDHVEPAVFLGVDLLDVPFHSAHLQSLNLKKLRTKKKQVTCSLLQKLPFHDINVAPTRAPCSLHTSKSLQAACKMFLTHKSVSLAKLNEKRFIILLPALLGFDDFFALMKRKIQGLILSVRSEKCLFC